MDDYILTGMTLYTAAYYFLTNYNFNIEFDETNGVTNGWVSGELTQDIGPFSVGTIVAFSVYGDIIGIIPEVYDNNGKYAGWDSVSAYSFRLIPCEPGTADLKLQRIR